MSADPKPSKKRCWSEKAEATLVDLAAILPRLHKVRRMEDLGEIEKDDISQIREQLNEQFEMEFTDAMVTKKWLEIRLLFDLKFAMNGYTLEDRGHHIRRDGSLKDDLNENWVLFQKLDFLVDGKSEHTFK